MQKVVVVTGGSAGVGRATAEMFAQRGYAVALLAREPARLNAAASDISLRYGVPVIPISTDVAVSSQVEAAAEAAELALGPIDVWVNAAMATVFAPVESLTAEEVQRATDVSYHGQVFGTMAALRRMRVRKTGCIVNVGSALAHRGIPLQSLYCGAKFAVRGFTESLRSEIIHDRLHVHLTMVDLPAINTPQFDWSCNKTGYRAQPVAPVFDPEFAARSVFFAATHRRRHVFAGWPVIKVLLTNAIAPGLVDRYLASAGYSGQITGERLPADVAHNLFKSVRGPFGARGRFEESITRRRGFLITERHRHLLYAAVAGVAFWIYRRK